MRVAAALLCAGLLAGCSSGTSDDQPTPAASAPGPSTVATPGPTTPAPAAPASPVVLAISVDGLNPDVLDILGADELPALRRLLAEGASTLNARTARELTITLPNHAGMLTGRAVGGPDGHSVTFNDDDGRTLQQVHGDAVPGMFDIAHDRGVRTALFAEKDKFAFLVRSWDGRHGARDVTTPDDGRDKIDVAEIGPADELAGQVRDAMGGAGPALVFWHLAGPDVAGHAGGWLGPGYLTAVREVDRRVGEVLDGLDADPALAARTTILLTADHGGARGEDTHDRADVLADHRIPFVAWGRGVRAGSDLYALDARRGDPGTGRPGYDGPQPVRNLDLADTALGLLGLPGLPDGPGAPVALR